MFYFPIISRLKGLFASIQTTNQMTWHYENRRDSSVLHHSCDGEVWKHFDKVHPDVAVKSHNAWLGLCSDGFNPFIKASSKPYSCWPVIVTSYNLPLEISMSRPSLFLSCLIHIPHNPKTGIDVYLQPLIDDLRSNGVMLEHMIFQGRIILWRGHLWYGLLMIFLHVAFYLIRGPKVNWHAHITWTIQRL